VVLHLAQDLRDVGVGIDPARCALAEVAAGDAGRVLPGRDTLHDDAAVGDVEERQFLS
jgi:hypothetical protein